MVVLKQLFILKLILLKLSFLHLFFYNKTVFRFKMTRFFILYKILHLIYPKNMLFTACIRKNAGIKN